MAGSESRSSGIHNWSGPRYTIKGSLGYVFTLYTSVPASDGTMKRVAEIFSDLEDKLEKSKGQ
jgi:hypothetical protein